MVYGIGSDCFSYGNKEKYEEFLHTDDKEAEIRINRGFVYRYVNIHGNTELDRDWDDTEEEWEEYRDCYEEFAGNLNQYYGEFMPAEYIRTGALYGSLDRTGVRSSGSGASAEVFFDTPSYQNGLVPSIRIKMFHP